MSNCDRDPETMVKQLQRQSDSHHDLLYPPFVPACSIEVFCRVYGLFGVLLGGQKNK